MDNGTIRLHVLKPLTALFSIALIVSTWPLWWTPPQSPQIPWLGWFCAAPRWIDRFAIGGLFAGAAGIVVTSCVSFLKASRKATDARDASADSVTRATGELGSTCVWGLFLICLGWLVLCDQQRLQPWAWQVLLYATILSLAQGQTALACCHWLTISVYLWSAVSKLDVAYLDAHGRLLLEALLQGLNIPLAFWSPESKRLLPLMFPLGELVVAFMLMFRRTRSAGLVLSLAMHGCLIWLLGGVLGHDWGVLLWNGFFLAQNLVLYWPGEFGTSGTEWKFRRNRASVAFMGMMVLAPGLERLNAWDHWPAWAVYSSRPEAVRIWCSGSVDQLPPEWRAAARPADFSSEEWELGLDQWSYAQRHCPIYPQMRYRLALGRAVLEGAGLLEQSRFEVRSTPDPWTGRRQIIPVDDKLWDSFWANTRARTHH